MNTTPLIQFTDTRQTMTSLEIAEVTGKQHKNVLRDIKNMEPAWEKVTGLKFELCLRISELANGVKKENPYYVLNKTECLYIATKFNDEARARLVIRWEELERQERQRQLPPPPPAEQPPVVIQPPASATLPAGTSRRQLLVMLIEAEDANARTQQTLDRTWQFSRALMADLDQLRERVRVLEGRQEGRQAAAETAKPGTYTATQLAARYGMKAVSFNNLLQQLHIQHCVDGQWAIDPDYAGHGYVRTRHVTVRAPDGQTIRKPYTVWTEAGRQFLHDVLRARNILPADERQAAAVPQEAQKGGAHV